MLAKGGVRADGLAAYRMVKSLRVLNFRCFKQLELDNLGRVNVVVGRNGSGKTSLLEAVYLAAGGGPQVALRLRRWRGFGIDLRFSATKEGYESLWRDLFFNFNPESGAVIEMTGDLETTRKLSLRYSPDEETKLNIEGLSVDSTLITPLTFETTDGRGTVVPSRLIVSGGEIAVRPPAAQPVQAAFFNSISLFDGPVEPASQLSALRQKNQADGLLTALKAVFPSIKSLAVEVISGSPMVCAIIPPVSLPQPLAIGSAGMTKLLHILLGIASMPAGIVLVDEIENGFYWDTLPLIWSTIQATAQEYGTQVFASTHSAECLRALEPSLAVDSGAFRLLRLTKSSDDVQPTATLIDGKSLAAAITEGFEIR